MVNIKECSYPSGEYTREACSYCGYITTSDPTKFPAEVLATIFQRLKLEDIKVVRLVCSRWGAVGLRFLFKPFVFRRDRPDFERFSYIIGDPVLSAGINSLRFQLGTMNIFIAAHNLANIYTRRIMRLEEEGSVRLGIDLLEGAEYHKEIAIREYANWNCRLYSCNQNYLNDNSIEFVLKSLKALECLEITLKSAPFQAINLIETWIKGSGNGTFGRDIKEFSTILKALSKTGHSLKVLKHDQLPVTFFKHREGLLDLAKPLRQLTTLHLAFKAIHVPCATFWNNFGIFLKAIPMLKDLRFGFDPIEYPDYGENMWIVDSLSEEWYVPLWHVLGKHKWNYLRKLRLDGMVFCETGLEELLINHNSTLRDLEFHHIALWQGSFVSLIKTIRSNLTLDGFRVSGCIHAVHEEEETWNFPRIKNPSMEMWSADFARFAQVNPDFLTWGILVVGHQHAPDIFEALANCFQNYVLTGSWPSERLMTGFSSLLFRPRIMPHNPQCGEYCWPTVHHVNSLWAERTNNPDPGWETPRNDIVNDDGEEVVEFYDENGPNDQGFDVNGYNEAGTHYLDINTATADAETIYFVVMEKVQRDITASIIHLIPRY